MKRYLPLIVIPLVFILTVMVFVACTYQREPMIIPTALILPTSTAILPPAAPQPTGADEQKVYPATPEAVVQAFLLALQADPVLALRYLSTPLKGKITSGGPVELLNINGVITGTAIQSGAVSVDPPIAQVDIGLQVRLDNSTQPAVKATEDLKNLTRRFELGKENDHWVINSIEAAQ